MFKKRSLIWAFIFAKFIQKLTYKILRNQQIYFCDKNRPVIQPPNHDFELNCRPFEKLV
jgi:hypothetical protein